MAESKQDYSEIPFHGGEALVRALIEEGCPYVFGIPGGEFIEFLEAVDRREHTKGDIHYIGVRHEQAAANMADGFSRVSGKIGVCCATVGPGLADLVPGVAPAYFDNIPILIIHPQMSDKFDEHHRLQQGLDQLTLLKPVVKYQKSIKDPNRIIWGAQKCFKALYSGRPGPVQLEIIEDAFHSIVEDYGQVVLKPRQYRSVNPPAANPQDVKSAVELLLKAERPLIVSGGGVTSSQGWEILRKLSIEFRIPVCTSVMGIGTMSSNHPTYIGATLAGGGVFKAAAESDVVLALGTKFSFNLGYGKPPLWNATAKLIQIDIDPQMIGKNKPVELGIVADCRIVLEQLYEEMKRRNPPLYSEKWLNDLIKERASAIEMAKGKLTSDKAPIHPLRLINDLTDFMDSEDIICTDGGDITAFLLTHIDFVKPRAPRTYLNSVGFGHLGVGIPYAIGAKLAKPQARVFCLSGDGSVLFNIQELYTASTYKIPFVVIVADNCSWGMIKNNEQSIWRKRMPFCVDLPESNFVKIAEGFGCYGERVDEPSQIKPALQRAIDSNKPALIHVPIKSVSPEGSKLLKMFKSLKF